MVLHLNLQKPVKVIRSCLKATHLELGTVIGQVPEVNRALFSCSHSVLFGLVPTSETDPTAEQNNSTAYCCY